MPLRHPRTQRSAAYRGTAAALLAAAVLSVAACNSTNSASTVHVGSGPSHGAADMDMGDMSAPTAAPPAEAAPKGDGLAASDNGYIYLPASASVPARTPAPFDFHITGPDDHALKRYQPYESKLVLFYLVRADLTGFQQLDPTMRQDGTWTVSLPALQPGSYRTYVTFAAPDSSAGTPLVYTLSAPLTVPGAAANATLPAASTSAVVDGYTVKLSVAPKAGAVVPLTLEVTQKGKPVQYFQRYLDGYAHLTAFRLGDGAFAHLLSTGRAAVAGGNGPLTAEALFPRSGTWRLFVQFQTGGTLHQAAFTVNVP